MKFTKPMNNRSKKSYHPMQSFLKSTNRWIIVKLQETKVKEKTLKAAGEKDILLHRSNNSE